MVLIEQINSGAVNVILGSKSPRRSELLRAVIPVFKIRSANCEELFPSELQAGEIAEYLSELKSRAFGELDKDTLLITADTIVWLKNRIYEKPSSLGEAEQMLAELSGARHHVFTAVTLRFDSKSHTFISDTEVEFEGFTKESIAEYVRDYDPLDKAGAYGIQDCLTESGDQIGPLSMKIISGSYSNVIGLPVEKLKTKLSQLTLI